MVTESAGYGCPPECRVSFRDTCGCILCRRDSRTADRLFFDAAALRSERGSTKRLPSPTPPTNGWTACRMPLQIFSAGSGKPTPAPLRKSVRALRLPRTTGLRVALHGRQRLTGVLNAAAAEGYPVTKELVKRLSPYMREHIRRFGQYVLNMDEVPEPLGSEALGLGLCS